MRQVSLALHEFRFAQKVFWRNPASVFFTALLPVLFLLIFATIFGDDTIKDLGGVKITTYYIPAIITLAVISATMVNLAMNVTIAREEGLLKRGRGTPLPPWVFIAGRVGNAIVISAIMVVVVTLIGKLLYDAPIPWDRIPAVIVTLVVGAASFCCLGLAITVIIPSREAASAITNAITLPLYFLSGIFIPENEIPDGVLSFANHFPVRDFFQAFFSAYSPKTVGSGFEWGELAVVALWGLAGLIIALRYFRWTPRS
ncbi:MAG: ABC transporter permease [Solirubrobacterales bacterium]|nr:ABC transporter permease [Solirubrobacterales bacterium]HRV60503.1 ABC transporter permease [Solirubrobacterales bacterium]